VEEDLEGSQGPCRAVKPLIINVYDTFIEGGQGFFKDCSAIGYRYRYFHRG
jgi:hypothetical protein